MPQQSVYVVIPCYRASRTVLKVIAAIGEEVDGIVVVDDGCPEHTGRFVREHCEDPRLTVITHRENQGVGGATISGFREAERQGAAFIVKVDADGQMDPALIGQFIRPLQAGEADYVKGNRFFELSYLAQMPRTRLVGNAALSFLSKLSSGYWDLMDPTNGYIALNSKLLRVLPLEKISRGYFFESDMLFRLNTVRAVVRDIPLVARYGDAESQMNLADMPGYFAQEHVIRLFKRIFYNYFLRDFSVASLQLVFGLMLFLYGLISGGLIWHSNALSGVATPTGTIVITALQIILGFQLLMSFLSYDMSRHCTDPITRSMEREAR